MARKKATAAERLPAIMATDHSAMIERFKSEAARLGLSENYLFESTLSRYIMQSEVLNRLKAELDASAATVERSYVRDTMSQYANPLLTELCKLSSAANQTAALLIKLVTGAEKRIETSLDEDDEL